MNFWSGFKRPAFLAPSLKFESIRLDVEDGTPIKQKKSLLQQHPLLIATLVAFIFVPVVMHLRGTDGLPSVSQLLPSTTTTMTTRLSGMHTDRVAMLLETRPSPNVVPVLLHFHATLGPSWPIVFYTLNSTAAYFTDLSTPFARLVSTGAVSLRLLDDATNFGTSQSVSAWLKQPWVWEDLAPYDKVLVFQDDSIICSNSQLTVDDFITYDFIGAPISPEFGHGFNGGLSLRNRALTLQIISNPPIPDAELSYVAANFEDQYFSQQMEALPVREDGSPGAKLPDLETAKTFAVETVWYDRPLGFHQIRTWNNGKIGEIREWCPEIDITSHGGVKNAPVTGSRVM